MRWLWRLEKPMISLSCPVKLGLTYSAFLGTPNLGQHPYADRDYVGFNIKYQL